MTMNPTARSRVWMACALTLLAGWSGTAVAQPAPVASTAALRPDESTFLRELDTRLDFAARLPGASVESLRREALRFVRMKSSETRRERGLAVAGRGVGRDVGRRERADHARIELRLRQLALPRAEARARDLRPQAPRPSRLGPQGPTAARPGAGFVTSGTGGISGNVSGPASAYVWLRDSNGDFLMAIPTDPGGAYTFTALAAGTYYVNTANTLGFIDEAWDDVPCSYQFNAKTECGGAPIAVADGATTSGIDFVLPPGGRIAGTVTAAVTSSPIADLDVEVYDWSGRMVSYGWTDPAGAYASGEGLPSGTYFVRTVGAGSNGFMDEVWDDIRCGTYCYVPSGTPVSVTSPSTTAGIDFALDPAGTISGRVTDSATGLPLANSDISVWQYGVGENFFEGASTDAGGYYTTGPVAVGAYSVSANASGSYYVGEVFGGSQPCPGGDVILCYQDGTPVSVTAGVTTPNVDFALELGGSVAGHITASDTGEGVGYYASFANAYWGYVFGVATYPDGQYSSDGWGGFPAGTYYVETANDEGYVDEMYDNIPCAEFSCSSTGGTPVILTPGNRTRNIDFVLSRSASSNLLTVSRKGSGTGTVTSTPAGISCGSDCSEPFAGGTSVTLSATPASGSVFAGWGADCSGTGSCPVTMNGVRSVEATFNTTAGAGIGVTWPSGGSHRRGTSLPIAWTSTSPTTYDLELWKGPARYQAVVAGASGTSYGWTLPSALPLGSDYRIRVADHAVPTSYSFSGYFTVTDATPAAGMLRGTVTSSTGAAIPGASFECGFWKVWTAANGGYLMSGLPPASYNCAVTASGFVSSTFAVTIPSGGDVRKDVALKPLSVAGAPRVLSVTHRWRDFVYLLPATPAAVDLTATVDWAGRTPGSVVFSVGGVETSVPTTLTTVTQHFSGESLQGCTDVQVWARAADGTTSAAVRGPFATMTRPSLVLGESFGFFDYGDHFQYKTTFKYEAIKEEVEGVDLPSDIPALGGKALSFVFEPKLSVEVTGAGKFEAKLEPGTLESTALFKVAGLSFNKLQPKFSVTGQYAPCGWTWSGGGELSVSADLKVEGAPSYFPIPTPFGPIPGYFAWQLKAALPVGFEVKVNPFALNGMASPKASIRGTLGVGVDRIASVEGWLSGNADITLKYPSSPHFRVDISVTAGWSVDLVGFTWDNQLKSWDLVKYGSTLQYKPPAPLRLGAPQLVSRDYLRLPSRASVTVADVFASRAATGGAPRNVAATSLAVSTLPHPEPDLSAAGSNVYGAWVVDDAARAAINRTKAVFASFDGTNWSVPVAISDDGTADFAPRVLTFADGKAWVVWQDANAALADTAPFEDMVKALEIRAALYDPALPGFGGSHRLTDNAFLDATPRLSGPAASDVVAVWIANPANGLLGTAAEPNTVQASWWNGTSWSAAETVAQVAYPILRSELHYDGASAFVVMSVDTDGNTETIGDQELALVRHTSGSWQPLEWLTSNAVVDANPRLVAGPGGTGTVLAWVQGDSVKVAADFAVGTPMHSHTTFFSSNVADFRLTRSGDGRMAIVWTKPSDFSSDIWGIFYDPATGTWGEAQQLTADEATEKETAPLLYGGSLISLYARRDIGEASFARQGLGGRKVEYVAPQAGPTDLVMVKTTLGEDVALVGGSFTVDPQNPSPGVPVTLSATATNLGEMPLGSSAVAFYNGDPGAGGVEVGRATAAGPVATGGQVPVSFEWTVPATTMPLVVYAVVDPDATSADRDRTNNVQQLKLALPDLQVSDAGTAPLGDATVSVVARVTNNGSTPAAASDFKFRLDSATGAVLHQETVPSLAVGQSMDVGFVLATVGLSNGSAIFATSDEDNAVAEYDETNNSSSLSVSLQPPSVDVGVTLADAPDPVVVGADLVYTASVANAGADTANGVTLTMPVPAGASYVSALATQGDCSEAGGTITCPLGRIEVAGVATVTMTVRPGAAGTLPATASVGATETDTNPTNDAATASTTVTLAGLGFYTVTPCRAVDSRVPTGGLGGQPLQAKVERTVVLVGGACGIPATAKAVSLNLTATAATADGHVRLYPAGMPTPQVSTLNFRAGKTRANNALALLGPAGDVALYAGMASGSVHVIIDVNGYLE